MFGFPESQLHSLLEVSDLPHEADSHRRTTVVGFHHHRHAGPAQKALQIFGCIVIVDQIFTHQYIGWSGNPFRAGGELGKIFIHGHAAGFKPAAGMGDACQFQSGLQFAVFTQASVQAYEDQIGVPCFDRG